MDMLPLTWVFLALSFSGQEVRSQPDPPCGGRLNSKDAGYITSPGYPQDYPSHQNCEWIVYAPEPNQKIVLNFNPHFEIEKHDCKYDFIEIRDGDSESADLLGKHCGNIAPPTIISSGSMLYIKFTSDYARQGAGFSLRYEIFKTGSEDCSKNFTSPNGTIESPGFPEKYPHNLDCTFTILAKPKMDIILQFLTFDLEHDPLQVGEGDCKYDWLDIWDGIPHVGPLIGKYCGTKTPSELRSSTGILSLTFHTDMAVAKDGFSARYYLVHQEPLENFQCNVPLGMESGRIANEQISASSTYSDGRWTPQQSRLHGDDNGWTPNLDSNKEYLQVDLRFLTVLTAIATQGAISRETQNGYFVKSYKLEVSTNGEDWMVYRHGKNHKVFQANNDATEVVLNKLHTPLLTRFVRIRPQTWHSGIALRLELYGCRVTGELFEGNMHYDTPDIRRFDPVPAQYVRVYPERWSPAGIGMRLEVLGCDWTDSKPTVETLGPTMKSEETTTPYPIDEEATECGENCSFEDDKDLQLPSGFNCNFDFPEEPCGWIYDHAKWLRSTWTSSSSPNDQTFPDDKNFLRLQSDGRREGQYARLISPPVHLPRSPVCMEFQYQATGGHGVALQVVREASQESKLLWVIREDQGSEWKHGRIILPSYDMEYQIVFEGVIGKGRSGEIAIDDIRISTDVPLENCMEPISAFAVDIPEIHGREGYEDEIDDEYEVDWSNSSSPTLGSGVPSADKEKSWLYTLDPILITIIAMSSLGVLLGAICTGLLLYCTCSYSGLSSRSCTTLENYNFELYDGLKHKVKMNHQKCCSEA
ncbi:PREDICTED: neuropilin-2 [Galeopterus variegatus]|uniref:Neuropilin n=1 Tax=Galeopterus variegatus TaxID=482537 RepID=A0ABM0SAK0_GALVR|nr:PREDICTED: neuropilin-2 [Galeopterus variegatus]